MSEQAPESEGRAVPRVQMAALYTAAAAAAFSPFACVTTSWLGIATAVAVVGITSFLTTRRRLVYKGNQPSATEIALGVAGHSTGGSVCGFLGLSLLALLRYGTELVAWLFGFSTPGALIWWYELVAYSLGLFFLFAVTLGDASEFLDKLYPEEEGRSSPFAEFLFQPKQFRSWVMRLLGGGAAVVFFAILAYAYDDASTGLAFGIEVALVVITVDLWELKSPERSASSPEPLVEQVKLLLQAAGYQVRIYPATGKSEADALIGLVDFLAIRSDHAMAGCVTDRDVPRYLRNVAANLQTAVWALQDQLSPGERSRIEIEPVIVLVGGSTSSLNDEPEISASIDRMYVRIIRSPPSAELAEIVADSDADRKVKVARELFDPPREWSATSEAWAATGGLSSP